MLLKQSVNKTHTMKQNGSVEVMKVTPELASEWLADMWGEQRNIRPKHVARLVSDMEAGRFRLSPDAILRVKGKLANGQHRLKAVIDSGKPQQFLVLESNDEELYKVVDAGLKRHVGDALVGMPYRNNVASIAGWVRAYDSGYARKGSRVPSEAGSLPNSTYPTQTEMIEYCLDNITILTEAATFVWPLYGKTRIVSLSIAAGLYVIASQASHAALASAKEFLTQLYCGGDASSAASDLRNRLISNMGSRSKLKNGYIFGITLKSFKSFRQGTRPGVLKWAQDEEYAKI